ncbi:hypothetical protein LEL_10726 [Akanthomyces lecanii RCEF 1005]|uniref:DUF3638 domain-containing protein n=1 Tax=Akanthomyces lecanii RCEF 1005 TaxID=1081108 RepID=A0A167VA42_CORDF|nr:hypothetical protein LEL_10726 [Akanthomyces lecanii RCEF 1005]
MITKRATMKEILLHGNMRESSARLRRAGLPPPPVHIIDESDEILSVKYELVYTMGAQRAVDHAPTRWVIIAEVLDMVRRCVPMVQAPWPDAVEVYPGHDGCLSSLLHCESLSFTFLVSLSTR